MSQGEVTLNSEKFKPVALSIVELYLAHAIMQSGSQLVANLANYEKLIFIQTL